MKKIRTITAIVIMLCMCFALSACGDSTNNTTGGNTDTKATESTQTQQTATEDTKDIAKNTSEADNENSSKPEQKTEGTGSDVLVVVFSATGTTKGVAEKIAAIEGADLYEIVASEPYSDDDLNWNDSNSRTTKEQNDSSVRPGIASETIYLSGYSKIYVGYPIWWGEEPRIMDTFVESYDFGNITMIPFCTSSSSGIGRSGKNLADNAGSGNWLDGARFGGSVSEDDLRNWTIGLQ